MFLAQNRYRDRYRVFSFLFFAPPEIEIQIEIEIGFFRFV